MDCHGLLLSSVCSAPEGGSMVSAPLPARPWRKRTRQFGLTDEIG